jgi:hypothetical protein
MKAGDINTELYEALRAALGAIDYELRVRGHDEVKVHPMLATYARIAKRARVALAKADARAALDMMDGRDSPPMTEWR